MGDRDTSGLWDSSQTRAPDRSVGVGPPKRAKRSTDQQPKQRAEVSASPNDAPVLPTAEAESPMPAVAARSEEEQAHVGGGGVLLALLFTSEQMDWLRKTADKRNLWAGELFEELFAANRTAVSASGVGPRTRRRNSNYLPTRVTVAPETLDEFVALASDLGTSRAGLGRAIVDEARR